MNNFKQVSSNNILTNLIGLKSWYVIYDNEKLSFRN